MNNNARAQTGRLPTATEEALREFVQDIESVGLEHAEDIWPDLVDTYRHAKDALELDKRMRVDCTNPLKIKRFIRSGQLLGNETDVGMMLIRLSDLLDQASANELIGEVVFVGEDDVVYVATVEGCVVPADPEAVAELEE